MEALDIGTLYWFETVRREWLTPLMLGLTRIGNWQAAIPIVALVAAMLAAARLRTTALLLLGSALAGVALCQGTKAVVQRPRPDVPWQHREATTWSFPSGHSCNSAAGYAAAAWLASRHVRRTWLSLLLLALGLLLPLGIGVSRMYLGMHYLTDVLGGWSLGLACALTAYWADCRLTPPGPAAAAPTDRPATA
jgi:undecaprenyl-diphosphatase